MTVCVTSGVVVCTSAPPAVTRSVSTSAPTSSRAVNERSTPTLISTCVNSAVLKPVRLSVTVYDPGCTKGNRNVPDSVVVVSACWPVSSFVSITVTAGSTPPVSSNTEPASRPNDACADTTAAHNTVLAKTTARCLKNPIGTPVCGGYSRATFRSALASHTGLRKAGFSGTLTYIGSADGDPSTWPRAG